MTTMLGESVVMWTNAGVLCFVEDSDEDKEVSRKRTVRQAASKAVSKQREILLGDAGSEDEEQEEQEEPYLDRMYCCNNLFKKNCYFNPL